MSVPVASGLTYEDLAGFPRDDHHRRELIDGELDVSPSSIVPSRRVVTAILSAFYAYAPGFTMSVDEALAR